jgi:hypothetical protein
VLAILSHVRTDIVPICGREKRSNIPTVGR